MTQLQDDQAKPKKHRMTFAEWRATNPPPDPEIDKLTEGMFEFVHTVLMPAFQRFIDEDLQPHAGESNPPSQTHTEEK